MRLSTVLKKWRIMSERSLRSVATEIGIGHATLMRIENGESCDGDTLARILSWLLSTPKERI